MKRRDFVKRAGAFLGGMFCFGLASVRAEDSAAGREWVLLLHGFARSPNSMWPLKRMLRSAGYETLSVSYPSLRGTLAGAAQQVAQAMAGLPAPVQRVHFVTHSLGGVVLRAFLAATPVPNLGRVVMIAPPNQGTQLVDRLEHWPMLGPVFRKLGSAGELATHRMEAWEGGALQSVEFGIIAGDRSMRPFCSRILPGPDDGVVAVERTKLPGMKDFITLHHTHTTLRWSRETGAQTIHFLRHGCFRGPATADDEPGC